MGSLGDSHQKVVWFDVSMQEVPGVDVFNSLDHHIEEHENRLGVKLSITYCE